MNARLAVAMCVSLCASAAHANGRFPAAQEVHIGPGSQSDTIVLRATFGLVVSRDAGATFHWLCEDALGYGGAWDPPVALASDGTLTVGLPGGLAHGSDDCGATTLAGLPSGAAADVDVAPSGNMVWALLSNGSPQNPVLRSNDGGAHFTATGASFPGTPFTIAVAPSNPMRVYVSALDATGAPQLSRSDDGGQTFVPGTRAFAGASEAYVAGVDPSNVDRVWIRANSSSSSNGTTLFRSDDGATSVQPIATTRGRMLGFAVSDDGAHVWIGGPDDGLLRSDGGGGFASIASTRVSCLRYHAGTLYVCGDWIQDGFALARWNDGAASMMSLLRFQDIAGAFACSDASLESSRCAGRWPMLLSMLNAASAMDAGGIDATAMDAPGDERAHAGAGCGCRASGRTSNRWLASAIVACGAGGAGAMRRARRRERRCP
jgi:hypothetical protein